MNLPNLHTCHSQCLNESHNEVACYGAPHEPPPVIMALDTGGDEQAAGVRPGDDLVLTPPPKHHTGKTVLVQAMLITVCLYKNI